MASHTALARRLGAKEAWIAGVRLEVPEGGDWPPPSLEGMEESWRTAVEYAELVTQSGHAVDSHVYQRLASQWNEGEIVEITLVAGLFAYFNRFNDALRVEVTK